MRGVIPVTFECWARAAVVGAPALLATAAIGAQGSRGGFAAAVVLLGAALYLAIVWRLSLRSSLREIVDSAEPAEAAAEPRVRTVMRAVVHLAWVLPLVALGVVLNALVVALTICLGYAASDALSANRLSVAEQRRDARLLREGRRYVFAAS